MLIVEDKEEQAWLQGKRLQSNFQLVHKQPKLHFFSFLNSNNYMYTSCFFLDDWNDNADYIRTSVSEELFLENC